MTIHKPGLVFSLLLALLMVVPSASAQVSTVVPGTITVFGEGSASVPAEEATIVITIGPDGGMYIYEDPATMQDGMMTAVPAETVDTSAVVAAIVALGIPEDDVAPLQVPFTGEWGTAMGAQPASILVTVSQPSVENLVGLLEAVQEAARAEGLFVNQFGVVYSVADCRFVRQQARADAVANARIEAEDQAAALEITLGDAVASRDTYPMGTGYYQMNSCTTPTAGAPSNMIYMAGQFDPTMPAEVTVTISLEVTFEIP